MSKNQILKRLIRNNSLQIGLKKQQESCSVRRNQLLRRIIQRIQKAKIQKSKKIKQQREIQNPKNCNKRLLSGRRKAEEDKAETDHRGNARRRVD